MFDTHNKIHPASGLCTAVIKKSRHMCRETFNFFDSWWPSWNPEWIQYGEECRTTPFSLERPGAALRLFWPCVRARNLRLSIMRKSFLFKNYQSKLDQMPAKQCFNCILHLPPKIWHEGLWYCVDPPKCCFQINLANTIPLWCLRNRFAETFGMD